MASYVVPQVEIHQLFSEIPVALATTQVPFVFGPNYLLHRYDDASEKLTVELGKYEDSMTGSTAFFRPYPGAIDEEMVDKSYTRLFGDNVCVKLGTFENVSRAWDYGESSGSGDDVKIPDMLDIKQDGSSDPEIEELAVGRMLRLMLGTGATAPHKDVKILKIVSVTESNTEIVTRVQIDEDLKDTETVSSAVLCEVVDGVEFPRKDFSDSQRQGYFWTEFKETSGTYQGHYGIKVTRQLKAYYTDSDYQTKATKYGDVLSADLYLTYRELITSSADTIHSLSSSTEVASTLGTVHPDNPLAQAVYNAALNAGGQTIRYMALPQADLSIDKNDQDTELEGYSTIFNAITLTKEVYFLVPATRNAAVIDMVQAHVNTMSAATTKRWRIAFVSAEIPETDAVYTKANSTDGKDFKAKVLSVDQTDDDKKKHTAVVQFGSDNGTQWKGSDNTAFKKDVKAGDILYFAYHNEWGKDVPYKFTVRKVLDNNRLSVYDPDHRLSADNSSTSSRDEATVGKAEIYHPYTNAEKATVIKNLSSSFADRRMYNVFPSVFSNAGVQQTGEFAAACVAGLVSSCLPQQPITNMELVGIDDIPMVYQTFSYDQLNTMASGGTFIVMQDLPNDQVYVRHQISTDYEANNLNTAELSITKNLDSISYFFDDLLSPYIGKYNITPELLEVLRNMITKGIVSLSSNSYGLYGSQLISEGTEILLLEQDALLKDHVNCNLQLNMPYPFNHLVLKLFV